MQSETPSQQPTPNPNNKQSLILYFIVIIILAGIATYLGYQNWQLRNTTVTLPTVAEPIIIEQSWTITPQVSQSIQEITNKLLSNTLMLTSTESGIPTFTKEFDLTQDSGWANFVISVFKYIPGTTIEEGYEGLSWTRNLDTEVQELIKVSGYKNGTYINQAISAEFGPTYTNVTVKNIGNQKYTITDTYFHPSGSWHRKYLSYNPTTNYIIEVMMGIKPEKFTIQQKNICYEDKCADFIFYPDEINNFFLELEALLEE